MKSERDRVFIFDTTLRDGEQSPGFSMNSDEKLRFARQLEKLGVDIIEAGFPVASEGDFESVQRIAGEIKKSQVAALARTSPGDIDRAWDAVRDAAFPRIHTFISTSDIHIKHMLKMTREQVLKEARSAVKHACSLTGNVEFSAQDATRTDRKYLCEIVEAVIDAGATTVNIPDTVGYAMPDEFGELIAYLFDNVGNIKNAVISVHSHDDLGVAVATSISGLKAGARQVECTINGIGERAGNASLEEVVMALETRRDILGLHTNINTRQIYHSSRLLSDITGVQVQPNKAIVGANAFAHESGIHQAGLIRDKMTYEIMTPEAVGVPDTNIVLGKHSGRNAIREHLKKMGFDLARKEVDIVFKRFKELADIKKEMFDEDIEAIIAEDIFRRPDKYKLLYLNVVSGNAAIPTATVQMEINGEVMQEAYFGVGPVDATFATIRKITDTNHRLVKYLVHAVTEGTDAQGVVTVQLRHKKRIISGRGSDPDVLVASAKAYINALNRIESFQYVTMQNGKSLRR
ncbi:MAG: 2-isopropylmalate synthase [Deltaproteobacteria bacterium]|nr:2-isopropylmalate synthase [Deltaproteobacteria bacterium]